MCPFRQQCNLICTFVRNQKKRAAKWTKSTPRFDLCLSVIWPVCHQVRTNFSLCVCLCVNESQCTGETRQLNIGNTGTQQQMHRVNAYAHKHVTHNHQCANCFHSHTHTLTHPHTHAYTHFSFTHGACISHSLSAAKTQDAHTEGAW